MICAATETLPRDWWGLCRAHFRESPEDLRDIFQRAQAGEYQHPCENEALEGTEFCGKHWDPSCLCYQCFALRIRLDSYSWAAPFQEILRRK